MDSRPARDRAPRLAFSRRLYALRRAYGASVGKPQMPQLDFAAMLGIGKPRYARYERGEVEPTLALLAALRRVTGISLDLLIAGETPGRHDLVPRFGSRETEMMVGDRIRLVREIFEPDVKAVACAMGVTVELWTAWEASACQPPVEKVEEFAHRFGASMDFLYRGLVQGMPTETLKELRRRVCDLDAGAPLRRGGPRRVNHTRMDIVLGTTDDEAAHS